MKPRLTWIELGEGKKKKRPWSEATTSFVMLGGGSVMVWAKGTGSTEFIVEISVISSAQIQPNAYKLLHRERRTTACDAQLKQHKTYFRDSLMSCSWPESSETYSIWLCEEKTRKVDSHTADNQQIRLLFSGISSKLTADSQPTCCSLCFHLKHL